MCVCVCEGPGLAWSGPSKPINALKHLTIVSPPSNTSSHLTGIWGQKGLFVEWFNCCGFSEDYFRGHRAKDRVLRKREGMVDLGLGSRAQAAFEVPKGWVGLRGKGG